MIVDRRLLPHIDFPLLAAVATLALIGLATVYTATMNPITGQPGHEFWTQVYALPIGFCALLVCLVIDYRTLTQRSFFIYGALLVGLVAVMYFGVVLAEHSEHGYFAAPIARFVLETYFAKQAGEPLPPLPQDSLPQFFVPPARTASGVGGQ